MIREKINSFLDAVEAGFSNTAKDIQRDKVQRRSQEKRKAAANANRVVDERFYSAKDEGPDEVAARKKSEISEMLGYGGGKDKAADGEAKARAEKISKEFSDREDLRMNRILEDAEAMDSGREKVEKVPMTNVSPLRKATMKPAPSEKGTGTMLTPRQDDGGIVAKMDAAPRANIVADDEVVQSFFSKTHGSSFDPESRADQGKMKQILKMVNSDPSLLKLTPGKFAVKVYSM